MENSGTLRFGEKITRVSYLYWSHYGSESGFYYLPEYGPGSRLSHRTRSMTFPSCFILFEVIVVVL
jgi:hypothetical protein